jgi:hypothetical protein
MVQILGYALQILDIGNDHSVACSNQFLSVL